VQELRPGYEEGEEHAEESGLDPHVWLNPVRLAGIAEAVAERMAQQSPQDAEGFRTRAAALTAELTALDRELDRGLSTCARNQLVTSHNAFGYLAERYGLEQVAVTGLSPEATPSLGRLAEVATYAKQNGVTTIFFEELVSPKTAQSLTSEVGARAVYRHLQALADAGQVDVLRTDDDEAVYRRCPTDGHHHHLVCRSCGRSVEVEGPEVQAWAAAIAGRHGFTDVSHTVEAFGACANCAA
jgi:ABC-type Zn uptake system ZnuABC Zn-binding protein ZnuA